MVEAYILKALDKCLTQAEGDQRRLFLWMKAALQYPDLERFMQEVIQAADCKGTVSIVSLHKAVEFAESSYKYQIENLSMLDEDREKLIELEKIRLKEVEIRIAGMLDYLGWLS